MHSDFFEPPSLSGEEIRALNTKGYAEVGMGGDTSVHVQFEKKLPPRTEIDMSDFVYPNATPENPLGTPPELKPLDFIRINIPGSLDYVEREVTRKKRAGSPEPDTVRFGLQYRAWKDGLESVGTPLSQWEYLSEDAVLAFRLINLYTVEQVAQAPDTVVQKMGSQGYETRRQAITFVFNKRSDEATKQIKAEHARQSEEIAELRGQLSQLMEALGDKKIEQKGTKHKEA